MAAAAAFVLLVGTVVLTRSVQADSEQAASKSNQHVLTVYDGGVERGVLTEAETLSQALKDAGFEINQNDITEPRLDEKLVAPTYDVNIYRARPVLVIDGATRTKVMTPYRTAPQIAKQAGLELRDEDKTELRASSLDMLSDGALERLVIDRATPVDLIYYGKKTTLYTHKQTVGELLTARNITLQADDTLSVPKETPIEAHMTIELWRNGKQTITEEHEVDFPVEKIQDANREAGYREVKTAGKKGKKTVTFEVMMKNGQEESRTEIGSVVTEQPTKQVEIVGAKSVYSGGPLSEAQINALGTCESGMTASRNSGNGFYGAFQFMPSTWRTVAPAPYNSVMPHEAPLDAQKQAVQNLLSRSSIYTQFPGCARKMSASGVL